MAYHYWIYRRGAGYCGENFSRRKDAIAYCRSRLMFIGYRIEATRNGIYAGTIERNNSF